MHCNGLSFITMAGEMIFTGMNPINGIDAIRKAQEISKVGDGTFTIAFYSYNRTKQEAGDKLKVYEGCKTRTQLPQERFSIDGDNFFLFLDKDGNPKTCYRILIRFMGFPEDGFKLRNVQWLNDHHDRN
ncbi:MAG: hypothetical protein V2A67_04445 [Bacteroidota bacterium]